MLITKVMFSSQPLSGISKERVIIPERILADKIYRNRNNLAYCREHRIRLSGPSLGRPKKNAVTDRKTEYKDNADRIAVERAFALAKQKYGLGLITSRLDETDEKLHSAVSHSNECGSNKLITS